VLIRDEQCFVRDLNSTNGTFVNDQQVSGEQELHDGDTLKVGPLDFGIRIEVQAEKPTEVERDTQAPEGGTDAAVPTAEVAEKGEVLDEDAVGSMLLELSGAEQAGEQDNSALEGSTIMDMVKSPSDELQQPKPAPYRPPSKQPGSAANTSSAAKAILEKYRRRPRS
jgi:pSer/pThr/pTyr-binding forkhead associated (FHA) protein